MKYKVGDKVRIVDKWVKGCRHNAEGRMDKWLGKVMTILGVYGDAYSMKEDDGTWYWYEPAIAGLAKDFEKKIVITTDGTETLARLYEGNKVIGKAVAKCSPEDEFDFNVGAKIAFDRLMKDESECKWRVVNRPAKAGDYIRLKQNDYPSLNDMGDILLVHNVLDDLVRVKKCNHKRPSKSVYDEFLWAYVKREYEVVEPADTPEEKPKYYNGKVVCVAKDEDYAYTVGKVYEFKDGMVKSDDGDYLPLYYGITTLEEWNNDEGSPCTFIPFVE